MKSRLLNLLLIITSLLGYLEWGKNNNSFLFQVEFELFTKLFSDTKSVIHPLTLLPLLGQLLLVITLFQKRPNKILTYTGIACLGILLGFIFLIGILGLNFKILLSALPFILTAIWVIRNYRKMNLQLRPDETVKIR